MFRGYDTGRKRLVAVKLFKLDMPPERVHQLVAGLERIVAANLSHPALALPIAAGITGVSAYLASDYVAADSLDLTVRERGRSSPSDAVQVAARLAGALDQAAEAGITHGCLHPRDVLMSSKETRLTGIGIGQVLAEVGVPVPVRRPYSAPERAAEGSWDRRADVFSLAALIHELLWGRRISGTGAQAVDELTDLAGGNLEALKSAFARALANDPAERHPTAAAFVGALKRALSDVMAAPPAAPEPEPEARTPRAAAAGVIAPEQVEPRLPLELARFTEVDVEPEPALIAAGPSIIEPEDQVDPSHRAPSADAPIEPEPLVLSWMTPKQEPAPAPGPALTPTATPTPAPTPTSQEPGALSTDRHDSTVQESQRRPEPPRRPTRPVARRAKPIEPTIEPTIEQAAPLAAAPPDLTLSAADPPVQESVPQRRSERVGLGLSETVSPPAADLTMLERSRSAVWPLLLAMVVGGTLGFAGGYAVALRGAATTAATNAAARPVPGREFTEGTVPEPPKTAAADEVRPKADAAAEVRPKEDAKSAAGNVARAAAPAAREGRGVPPAPEGRSTRASEISAARPAEGRGARPQPERPGRLNIRSTPAGASVFIDDREAGRTPTAVRDLAEGPHRVRLVRDGFTSSERRIVLTRARPVQTMAFSLARVSAAAARPPAPAAAARPQTPAPQAPIGRGSLIIDSRPTGAKVFLDGKLLGTTPLSAPEVAAGDHAIRLEREGYRNWVASVRVVASEQNRVRASMER